MTMGTQQVRRLIRRTDGKVIAGVAAGLGDYFAVDPLWFRLGFIFAVFAGGAGVIAYGVMWLLMPKDASAPPTDIQRRAEAFAESLRGTPSWIGVALVIVGGLLFLSHIAHWDGAIFWGIALIIAGVAVFNRHEAKEKTSEPISPAVPETAPTAQPADLVTTVEQPRAARARRRSALGWLTIGTALVAVGAAVLLDVGNVVHIALVQYLALPLAILGIGMAIGTWWGRARWLTAPALLLTPFVLAASLVHVPFRGGSGDVSYRPASIAAVRSEYHLTAGQLVLDLRALKVTQPVSIRATVVAGHLLVRVPAEATLVVRGRVGGGEVDLFGRTYDGFNVDIRRSFGTTPARAITLDLETSLGQVEVETLP
jgi:phage shock protein PspC (stress-responsive transcriptional regulator)